MKSARGCWGRQAADLGQNQGQGGRLAGLRACRTGRCQAGGGQVRSRHKARSTNRTALQGALNFLSAEAMVTCPGAVADFIEECASEP